MDKFNNKQKNNIRGDSQTVDIKNMIISCNNFRTGGGDSRLHRIQNYDNVNCYGSQSITMLFEHNKQYIFESAVLVRQRTVRD